jgi:hypothetical protein
MNLQVMGRAKFMARLIFVVLPPCFYGHEPWGEPNFARIEKCQVKRR